MSNINSKFKYSNNVTIFDEIVNLSYYPEVLILNGNFHKFQYKKIYLGAEPRNKIWDSAKTIPPATTQWQSFCVTQQQTQLSCQHHVPLSFAAFE